MEHIFLLNILRRNKIRSTIQALRNALSREALNIPKEFKQLESAPLFMFCGSATGENQEMLPAYNVVNKADDGPPNSRYNRSESG